MEEAEEEEEEEERVGTNSGALALSRLLKEEFRDSDGSVQDRD